MESRNLKRKVRVYLAARFSRMGEMQDKARDLRKLGYTVDIKWITGDHGAVGDAVESASDSVPTSACRFAMEDFYDIDNCDVFVFFSHKPSEAIPRGSRHVEFGLAYAWDKKMMVVGPAENIFHRLPGVTIRKDWDTALVQLAGWLTEIKESDMEEGEDI